MRFFADPSLHSGLRLRMTHQNHLLLHHCHFLKYQYNEYHFIKVPQERLKRIFSRPAGSETMRKEGAGTQERPGCIPSQSVVDEI